MMNNIHDTLTQFNANNTINQIPENEQENGGPDKGATKNHLKANVPHLPSTTMEPPINVICSNGQIMKSIKPYLIDLQ